MNCERNICYQQDYNGGCDTCPCNDMPEPQECNEENGQSMTNQEIIEQLKSLKSHCKDFRDDEDGVWAKDVEALGRAIEAVEKQATSDWIPVSERLPSEADFIESYRRNKYLAEFIVMIEGATRPTTLYFRKTGIWVDENGDPYRVTAWQPLPEPYKENE